MLLSYFKKNVIFLIANLSLLTRKNTATEMLRKYYPAVVFSICTNKNAATVMSLAGFAIPILFCVLMWWARQQQQCFRNKNHVTMLTQYMSYTYNFYN